MITIPLWEMIVFVLSSVVLGAAIVIVSRSRRDAQEKLSLPTGTVPTTERVASAVPNVPQQPKKTGTLSSDERMNRITAFLKKRIASKRSVTVDEAAKCLNVSPRRVRRLLDNGVLIAIPLQKGGRRVSAVSVLDLLVRRGEARKKEVVIEPKPQELTEEQKLVKEIVESTYKQSPESQESQVVESQEKEAELVPTKRQSYWYYVEGYDKPFRTIRESVRACGLDIVCTGWGEIPRSIRSKIRRERVQS